MSTNFLCIIICFGSIIIDQLTKWLIEMNLYKSEITLIDNLLDFTYVENYGVAWGVFNQYDTLLKVIIPIFIAIIVIFLIKSNLTDFESISGSLIVGGAIGNYIDRLIRGYVIDFIDFKIWPVFNFADICIVVGCMMLIIAFFVNDKLRVSQDNINN